ncbi:MAG TPA: PfkB family carbohydrate kinase [Pseudomonadales bacterium]|nr:PfkB family carbohydrate kinase [Pseudomonadales bacterium]
MTDRVLVCGSIAIDFLGSYPGSFADYQERYPIKALNFSLQLGDLRMSFGGCGMNIAYGLKKLGVDCTPLTSAGANFEDHYRAHLEALDICIEYIAVDPAYLQCATAIVVSDTEGNQITAFHAGASRSTLRKLPSEIPDIEHYCLAVLAPEEAPIMLRQARDLKRIGVPVLFDPGQGISEFSREEVRELLDISDYVIANAHEWEILQLNGHLTEAEVMATQRQTIVTHSAGGVDIFERDTAPVHVPAIAPRRLVDATGCGDAFRAGYVFGLINRLPSQACARLGCLTATYNLENPETQRYSFSPEEFSARYREVWGEAIPLG